MTILQITTDAENDRVWWQKGVPSERQQIAEGDITHMGRMLRGMESGANSVAMFVKLREPLKDGKGNVITHVFAETSMALFATASGAFQGAQERDGQPF